MTDLKDKNDEPKDQKQSLDPEAKIKRLLTVVCICKGINLGRVLKALEGSETVDDVNKKTGCGTGGCKGERCGPRIKILLRKYKEQKEAKK